MRAAGDTGGKRQERVKGFVQAELMAEIGSLSTGQHLNPQRAGAD